MVKALCQRICQGDAEASEALLRIFEPTTIGGYRNPGGFLDSAQRTKNRKEVSERRECHIFPCFSADIIRFWRSAEILLELLELRKQQLSRRPLFHFTSSGHWTALLSFLTLPQTLLSEET